MDAVNRPAGAGVRQVRSAVLVTVLVLTGSAASAMAAGASPSGGEGPKPVVTAPVSDPADLWTSDPADDEAGDMAPMADPVEDVDESVLDEADDSDALVDGDMAPMVDPVEDVDESGLEAAALDDGDMAPMVDPVEDVDESALGE